MYNIIEFKLTGGLEVKVKAAVESFTFFRSGLDDHVPVSPNRYIAIEVPDSGKQDITLMRYVVGERIVLRKSLMGLKLVRGLPDFTGKVARVDLAKTLPAKVKDLKERHIRSSHMESMLSYGNLCQEIPLSSGIWPTQGTEITWGRNPQLTGYFDTVADSVHIQALHQQVNMMGIRGLYYARATDRNEASRRYAADYDGDMVSTWAAAAGPEPRYTNDPWGEVSLASAVQAAAELAQGERGRPPASRGPRPRNQRW